MDLKDTKYRGYNFFLPADVLPELKTGITNFNMQLLIRTDLQELPAVEQLVFEKLGGNTALTIESYRDVVSFAKYNIKACKAPIYGLVVFTALFGVINLIMLQPEPIPCGPHQNNGIIQHGFHNKR